MPDEAQQARAAALARFLADFDEPCPSCGYNLRGLTTANCPECNLRIELAVRLAEPRLGRLLAAGSGLIGGSVMGGTFLAIIVVISLIEGPPPNGYWLEFFGMPLIAFLLEGALAVRLLRPAGRNWFRTRTDAAQRATIVGSWGLTLVLVIIFMSLIWP